MARLCEKLWNWGHLEGSHDDYTKSKNTMTPEQFAEEYGVKNAFIISFTGNIQPPFDAMAERFSCIRELKWSVLGDASTPIPKHELGNTPDIIDVLDNGAELIVKPQQCLRVMKLIDLIFEVAYNGDGVAKCSI